MEWGSRQENAVTVVASGEVRARANILHLTLEIRTRGATATDALRENDLRERSVRGHLRTQGIHEESVETSAVSFLPAAGDGITLPGTTEPQGFIAVRSLAINLFIHEEDSNALSIRIARILDAAAEGGAQAGTRQQVNLAIFRSPAVVFVLDRDDDQRTEALRRAMLSAREAAREMAQSMGAELDSIQSTQVMELGTLIQSRWGAAAFGMPGVDSPRPVEPGRVTVRAVVAVTYRVRPISNHRERLPAGHFTLDAADSATHAHSDAASELP